MNTLKSLALAAAVTVAAFAVPQAQAQYEDEPACPYGYYDYAPYACAPYGYYGPEWFLGGAFLGAGPWFHGNEGFRGRVDHHFDPNRGYHGASPERGEAPHEHMDHMGGFAGSEMHAGRGAEGGFGGGHEGEIGGHEGGMGGGHEGGMGGGHEGGGHR